MDRNCVETSSNRVSLNRLWNRIDEYCALHNLDPNRDILVISQEGHSLKHGHNSDSSGKVFIFHNTVQRDRLLAEIDNEASRIVEETTKESRFALNKMTFSLNALPDAESRTKVESALDELNSELVSFEISQKQSETVFASIEDQYTVVSSLFKHLSGNLELLTPKFKELERGASIMADTSDKILYTFETGKEKVIH